MSGRPRYPTPRSAPISRRIGSKVHGPWASAGVPAPSASDSALRQARGLLQGSSTQGRSFSCPLPSACTLHDFKCACYTFSMKSGRVLLVLAVVFALPGAALSALSFDELDANASLVFVGSNPPSGYNLPNLAITPLIGVSVPFRLSGPFFIEPGLEFLGLYYQWISGQRGGAHPLGERFRFLHHRRTPQPAVGRELPGFSCHLTRRGTRAGFLPAISLRAPEPGAVG